MVAFIIAGFVFVGTVALSGLMLFAAGMSDAPSESADKSPLWTFIIGTVLAALIAASHWLPALSW